MQIDVVQMEPCKILIIKVMKKAIVLLVMLLTAAVVIPFEVDASRRKNSVKCSKKTSVRIFKVAAFHSLSLPSIVDVEYTQGPCRVEVKGPKEAMQYVECRIRNGELSLYVKDDVFLVGNTGIKAKVSAPVLKSLKSVGTADFKAPHKVSANNLRIFMAGTGDIDFSSLKCVGLNVNMEGTGAFKAGLLDCGLVGLNSCGTGDIKVKKLTAKEVDAMTHGTGDINIGGMAGKARLVTNGTGDIKANGLRCGNINAMINGSGDIFVRNKSSIARKVVQGSGEIK